MIEGYVDKVEWPHALDKFRDFFSYYTARITAERPANIHTIERYLLLAGDLPGLKFKNSLKPSTANQGAATLIVEIVSETLFDWAARVDNRGPPGQGPLEFLASVTLNNLLRVHDALTLSYAGPFKPEELKYIYGQYSQVLNAEGLLFFVDASDGWGRPELGPSFQQVAPNYRTKSVVFETGLTFPWIRTRERNLSTTVLWFASNNDAFTPAVPDFAPSSNDRLRGGRFKVNGDWADPFNGINQVNVVMSHGLRASAAPITASRWRAASTAGSISASSRRRSRGCSHCQRISPCCSPPMDNWPARRCSTPSCAPMGGGCSAALMTRPPWWPTSASRPWASCDMTSR